MPSPKIFFDQNLSILPRTYRSSHTLIANRSILEIDRRAACPSNRNWLGAALGGAIAGAAVGTVAGPIGTVAGTIAGGAAGAYGGKRWEPNRGATTMTWDQASLAAEDA